MRRVAAVVERLTGTLCRFALGLSAIALLASFALVVYSVAMRYFVNQPIPWVDELVGYLLVGIVMLAAADALRRGEHIAVDLVTDRLGYRGRLITTFASLVAVAIVGLVFVVGGLDTASFTRMLGIRSTGYLAVPMHWPQLLIPVGGLLLLVAAIGGLIRLFLGLAAYDDSATSGQPGANTGASGKPGDIDRS
jgi:C4-dicarboxylate transporter, DctQ subunit